MFSLSGRLPDLHTYRTSRVSEELMKLTLVANFFSKTFFQILSFRPRRLPYSSAGGQTDFLPPPKKKVCSCSGKRMQANRGCRLELSSLHLAAALPPFGSNPREAHFADFAPARRFLSFPHFHGRFHLSSALWPAAGLLCLSRAEASGLIHLPGKMV